MMFVPLLQSHTAPRINCMGDSRVTKAKGKNTHRTEPMREGEIRQKGSSSYKDLAASET